MLAAGQAIGHESRSLRTLLGDLGKSPKQPDSPDIGQLTAEILDQASLSCISTG
jgi:hypothetical protein